MSLRVNATIIAKAYPSHISNLAVVSSSDSAGSTALVCTAILFMELAEILARVTDFGRRIYEKGRGRGDWSLAVTCPVQISRAHRRLCIDLLRHILLPSEKVASLQRLIR